MSKLTHTDSKGKASMVDVGRKPIQHRKATAKGCIRMKEDTIRLIRENEIKKGDVLTVAEVSGIQAVKRTSDLIPLCHPLQITKVEVTLELQDTGVEAVCKVHCVGQTGVEMEALTGVTVALLTVYDMCKAVDKHMVIEDIILVEKTKA
jgi:cyclic pyranopterin phosphate synthase